MKVLMINVVCGIRSTGRICTDLAAELEAEGHEVRIAYGRESVPEQFQRIAVRIGSDWDVKLHGIASRLLDRHGLGSIGATRAFLRGADEYGPDLLWLHNIHGYYINYELLFDWIKSRPDMQVRWTLHDCWAFTGHCAHFTVAKCEQWKTECRACPQKRRYPASLLADNCRQNFARKRAAFTGVSHMTLITPSRWLADLVKQSCLRCYPVEVRYNIIDTRVFKPTPGDFRERYGLENKKIVLGVASAWDDRKGLKDFFLLSDMLDDDYKIVLVGLSGKQIKALPGNILGLPRSISAQAPAEIYTAADVFVNPTHEDNYPSTNLEAQACGTPVITYRTGGSPESVPPENVVECGDVAGLAKTIIREICN